MAALIKKIYFVKTLSKLGVYLVLPLSQKQQQLQEPLQNLQEGSKQQVWTFAHRLNLMKKRKKDLFPHSDGIKMNVDVEQFI